MAKEKKGKKAEKKDQHKIKVRPVYEHCVVRPDPPAQSTPGGILLPQHGDAEKPATAQGTILRIDDWDDLIKDGVQVIYRRDEEIPIEHNGEKLVLLPNQALIAVIEE
jgi:co-chaperonin GroES (HSP10)